MSHRRLGWRNLFLLVPIVIATTASPGYAAPTPAVSAVLPSGIGAPMVTDPWNATFAVAMTTTAQMTGTLIFGTTPTALTQTAFDDRDCQIVTIGQAIYCDPPSGFVSSTIHRFTLNPPPSGLAWNTTYYYEPVLDGQPVTNDGQPFSFTTLNIQGPPLPPVPFVSGYVSVATTPLTPPGTNDVLTIGYYSGNEVSGGGTVTVQSFPQSGILSANSVTGTLYGLPLNPLGSPSTVPGGWE